MSSRSYAYLLRLPSFEDRFEYLNLAGLVGSETFGGYRYLNQSFYTSREWRLFRDKIIVRDDGCDLAIPDRKIHGRIIIHHINPLTIEQIKCGGKELLDPDNVVCVSQITHKAIHYGDKRLLYPSEVITRKPNDTCPWKEM